MKEKLKGTLCLTLALLMAVPLLASCANDTDEQPKTTDSGAVSENAGKEPEFEEADYDGAEFKFLIYDDNATDYTDEYIWSENVTGSAIGDAVADRNRLVDEKYNVNVTAEKVGGPMGEAVRRMQAGQCDFDVIYDWGIRSKSAAMDGMLYDFLDLQDHIDLSQSYWLPNSVETMTIGNHLFIYSNLISMNSLAWCSCLFFNRPMIDDLHLTMPYDYVYSNTWTWDVYLDMCETAASDLDGDGIMTIEDRFADLSSSEGLLVQICSDAAGTSLLQMNDDGSASLVFASEKCLAAYEKYSNRLNTFRGFIGYDEIWGSGADLDSLANSKHVAARKLIFGQNHTLFLGASIDMTKEMTDQPVQYGVVPDPLYDANGEYKNSPGGNPPIFTIPLQVEDPDMVGTLMEYMAYESEQILLPAFYEQTIKTKRMDDSRDYEMLDIIKENIEMSWTSYYLWDTDYSGLFSQMASSGNFASVFRRNQAKVQAQVDEVIDKLSSINN